jgi:nucleoid-associated protein YgaU
VAEQKLAELRRERQLASRVAAGVVVETPSGALPAGKGVVIIGRPSGAEPIAVPETAREHGQPPVGTAGSEPSEAEPDLVPGADLADFVMEVRSGQTLSGIAHAVYGTAPSGLVRRLAEYNGLESPDMLRAGQRLSLPPRERLE